MIAEMVFLSYINTSPIIGFVIYIYIPLPHDIDKDFSLQTADYFKGAVSSVGSNLFRQEGVRENDCSAFKEEK